MCSWHEGMFESASVLYLLIIQPLCSSLALLSSQSTDCWICCPARLFSLRRKKPPLFLSCLRSPPHHWLMSVRDTGENEGNKSRERRRKSPQDGSVVKTTRGDSESNNKKKRNTSLPVSCSSILMCKRRSSARQNAASHTYACMHTAM